MNECKGQPQLQKAVALALYLKQRLGRSSMMKNYTINKLHELTGVSSTTLKKYLPILKRNKLIHFNGKNDQNLIVSKIASHTNNRNICVDRFCFDSFKDVYSSLRAFLLLIIQSHKDFVKRTIQIATNPKRGQKFKEARKLVKRLVKQGILHSIYDSYKEYGLSYKRIAKETGNCVRTAQRIVKYAISNKWITKQKHQEQVFAKNVCFYNVDTYTFSTKNNIYRIFANTYELNKDLHNDIMCK